MGGDLRQSTKYIDWAPVPSRWIERRFLVFTALRSPGFFLLHLVLLPIMLLSVMFAGGIFSNAGVPVLMLLVLILLAWTAIFEFYYVPSCEFHRGQRLRGSCFPFLSMLVAAD